MDNRVKCVCDYCGRTFYSEEEDNECISCWSKNEKGEPIPVKSKLNQKAETNLNTEKNPLTTTYPEFGSTKIFLREKKKMALDRRYFHYFLGTYIPTRYQQDLFSGKILDFKSEYEKKYEPAARTFAKHLINEIYRRKLDFDIIVPIPSSHAGRIASGHKLLTSLVSKRTGIENGTGILNRTENIRKSATSGSERPDINEHLFTLSYEEGASQKKVMLFDDIYTTGSTAGACLTKLYDNGVSDVKVITLGKTTGIQLMIL